MARARVRLISNFAQVEARIAGQIPPVVLRACYELQTAWMNVLEGTRSGRRYKVPGTGQKGVRGSGTYYTASAPGEAPAPRFGAAGLRGSIRIMPRVTRRSVQARVGTPLDYAVYLEYGTRYMQPRVHLGRAWRKSRHRIKQILREAVD